MIREIWGRTHQGEEGQLLDQMFRSRARMFKERMKWDVMVDENGHERDAYDLLDPLYTIACDEEGEHVGSMRMLPTSGPTMLAEHFANVADGIHFDSDSIWEVTRFCVEAREIEAIKRHGVQNITQRLMLACCEIGLRENWRFVVGIFDKRMRRIYRRVGWSPLVIGEAEADSGPVYLGLWEVAEEHAAAMREMGGLEDEPNLSLLPPRRLNGLYPEQSGVFDLSDDF